MAKSWSGWYWHLGVASCLAIGGAIATSGNCALAQIAPDATLGAESSVIEPTNIKGIPSDRIYGGAIRGANLFHSFREFNIDEGRGAYFTNPAGIENILSRVTGANPSNIQGKLGVLGGNANLFLINPNGIIFGRNASLDVGGSFVGTTANAIGFGNQGFFSASAPNVPSILTVNPSAFFFNQIAARPITNQSSAPGLTVPFGKTLLLLGGDVRLSGGKLFAPAGRVELGGVAGAGTVKLNVEGGNNNLSLSFPNDVQRADVYLTNTARVNVASSNGGGSIAFNARNVDLVERSTLHAGIIDRGVVDAQAGDITLNATEAITVANDSGIFNEVGPEAVGNGGSINITTGSLSAINGYFMATTFGQGNAGSVTITARDRISFDGSFVHSSVQKDSSVQEGAVGNSGGINITTGSLSVTDGTQLVASVFKDAQGNPGSVTITARDTVSFNGAGGDRFTGVFSDVGNEGEGDADSINITTGSLTLKNGAFLSTSTFGQGNAGSVTITARDTISFDGVVSIKNTNYPSGAFSNVEYGAVGKGGSINITTGSLSVMNGAQVATSTRGLGNAGSVNIHAGSTVSFDGVDSIGNGNPSGAFSNVESGAVGNGGSINITAELLALTNGTQLSASSIESGAAVSMEFATRPPNLMDNQASLISDTTAGQGNIILRSQHLVLRRGSKIFTNAAGTATGGNINIDTGVLAALENSDITANAQEGPGGRVIINTQGIFGTQFRNQETPLSDITASSNLGPNFSGIVEINTPDVDPSRGLLALAEEVVDVAGLINQNFCAIGSGSSFTVTGRGGLPPSPNAALNTDATWEDWRLTAVPSEHRANTARNTQPTNPTAVQMVEATGWVINDKGEVVLIASAPTVTPHGWVHPPSGCQALIGN